MAQWSDFFVSPVWLNDHLADARLSIVDGSWYLDPSRDAEQEYKKCHIPGAVFFDLDAIADQTTDLPHMLPTPEEFAKAAGALGILHQDSVVIYDGAGLFSAARVWWTFRVMGVKDVRILEGGLPAWRAARYPLTDEKSDLPGKAFEARFDKAAVVTLNEMYEVSGTGNTVILDARPGDRFSGKAPEPRAGLKSGHMPGSTNLPATDLIDNGCLKDPEILAEKFDQLGINNSEPVITTCGSGVTAAILSLALAVTGHEKTRLYDGSWAEWGALPDTDVLASD